MNTTTNRRNFLKAAGLTGTGLAFSLPLSGCASSPTHNGNQHSNNSWHANAWLELTPDNRILFYLHRTEMGQGTMTGLTTLIAEELEVEPHHIEVKTSGVHTDYVNPLYGLQITGGSSSTATSWIPLRTVAATAREMLRSAAAKRWNVKPGAIKIQDGKAHYQKYSFTYGELVDIAKDLSVPSVTLKTPDQFQKIGKPSIRLDAPMKSKGTARFGIDSAPKGCLKASVVRCPVIGGTVKSWNANGAFDMPGVKKIVAIPNGIAVIAISWWQAKEAAKKLSVEWNKPEFSKLSDDAILEGYRNALKNNSGKTARDDGDTSSAFDSATQVIEAEYRVPYLAHATMEPMNCSVVLNSDHCEVWAPTQGPDIAAAAAEHASGLRRSQVTINTTLMGGGFGRRLNQDFVEEAVHIAKESGLPIQLIWSREDDIKNDFYRPAVVAQLKGSVNAQGQVDALYYKGASPNIMPYTFKEASAVVLPAWLPDGMVKAVGSLGPTVYGDLLLDETSVEGASDSLYEIDNFEVRHVQHDPGLRVGFWRSVGHSYNGFFIESFIDELAHASNKDAYQFRLDLLKNNAHMTQVLSTVADKGNWGKPAQGKTSSPRFQGIAVHHSFKSYVALLAEVSVHNNKVNVHKITCAVHCGQTINPDIVKAQMSGGIIFGLTQAMKGKISIKDGAIQETNFHNYELLRINEVPEIEVHIIPSSDAPTGVGEPAVPVVAPAIANAIFAATGKRLRALPLTLDS